VTVTSATNPPTSSLQKKIKEKKTWLLNDIVNRGLIVLVALLRLPICLFDVLRYQNPRADELLDVGDGVVLGHVDSERCAHKEGEGAFDQPHVAKGFNDRSMGSL
jgi:hypothetical protein